MDYGHFSEDGREFIITRPDTPRPWVNCLTNGSYCAIVSQTGGGYSFIGGPGYDRITRADPDIASSDRPGRYIFVRDDRSDEYFSIGWQPVKQAFDWFECRHAPGLTTIASSCLGITGSIVHFIPLDDNLEIWRVRIENTRGEHADLSVFTYVEWVLGNYADDVEERELANQFNEVSFRDNYIVATKRAWRRPDSASLTLRQTRAAGGARFLPETLNSNQTWGKYAFIALSVPVEGFDCDRQAFLGRYGELGRPAVVEGGQCTNSEGSGRDAVGVLQARLSIPPGGSAGFDVLVGVVLHEGDPSGVLARYAEPGLVAAKLDDLTGYWASYTSKLTVSTPDADLDRSINIWDKYQTWVSVRSLGTMSLYRGGASTVRMRESCYDLPGALPMDPEFSRTYLGGLMQHQYTDGSTVHYWEPRSDVGTRTGHIDDPLWLVFGLTSYLKETGDLAFLDETIKYYYGQRPALVYEHMVRALEFCLEQVGCRGLLLLGPGDWNEALDQAGREGKGESVVSSQMLCWMLSEAAEVARLRGDRPRTRAWLARVREIAGRLAELAWDGEWYIRAFSDRGERLGSRDNLTGSIYLNPQSWAVISRTAAAERAVQSMDGVRKRLDTPYGPAILLPAYPKPDGHVGTITRLSPGAGMNGGIWTLAACWAVMAECTLGRGARAYELYRKLLPAVRGGDQERYAAEPYAHAEHVFGPDSPDFGRGAFTWVPGLAAWMWRMGIDWICGVRPDYPGLRIDPCVPPDWGEFSVIRPFRDAVYRIVVRNPDGVEKGVREIAVDGRRVRPDAPIPDFRDFGVHEALVTMGRREGK